MAKNPSDVYEALVAEITDEDVRKVFDVLLQADGGRVSRVELVREVYGVELDPLKLSASVEDRKVRKIIKTLRDLDYPIVSSSGESGYTMKASPEEMDIYIADQLSRMERIRENVQHARHSREKAKLVKECREALRLNLPSPTPVQMSFMAEVQ